jgi:hypothetical protein
MNGSLFVLAKDYRRPDTAYFARGTENAMVKHDQMISD